MPIIKQQAIPEHLEIAKFLLGSHFADCFVAPNPWPSSCAMEIFLRTVESPPRWVTALMRLRNRLVQLVGLKDLGALHEMNTSKTAADYGVGERAGIFTVIYRSEDEVVLGDHDKHLEVRVSVSKRSYTKVKDQILISTVVHEHNALGKFYMLFVGPIHKLIVPAVLRRGLKQSSLKP
jgi:hypothetical protein